MYKFNRVSELTASDYVSIITTMEIMADPTFYCSTCLNLKKKPEAVEAIRKTRFCREISPKPIIPIKHTSFKIMFSTCPGNFYNRYAADLTLVSDMFKKGVLPYGKSVYGLANKMVEALMLIDQTQKRIRAEKSK